MARMRDKATNDLKTDRKRELNQKTFTLQLEYKITTRLTLVVYT